MQITVVNLQDKSVENLIAFDAAIMPLIGCTASAFEAVSSYTLCAHHSFSPLTSAHG
jgi:hypothetical protein